MTNPTATLALACTLLCTLLCVVACEQQKSTFTDTRDGKKYKTVKIGEQVWFAENLNIKTGNSVCYENEEINCKKYGRLYDLETAMKACPSGWHLPSEEEWETLEAFASECHDDEDCYEGSNMKLKAKIGWLKNALKAYDEDNGNGTDNYGFSALPGGYGSLDGYFHYVGEIGYWWHIPKNNRRNIYVIQSYERASMWLEDKSVMYSVRCIQDQ